MSDSPLAAVAALAAAVLFLLEMALSALLLAISFLSRVALRRLSAEEGGRLGFLDGVKGAHSAPRIALHTARQMSLLGGSLAAALAARAAGWPHPWLLGAAAGVLVGVLLAENVGARAIAIADPRAALRTLGFLVRPVRVVTLPLVAPLVALGRRGAPGAPEGDEGRGEEIDEEVDAFIEVGEREGILEADEGAMVRGIVDLGETRVREVMVPRTDIVAIPAESTVADARRVVLEAGHSRVPAYRGTIDEIVGVLHARDLLRAWAEGNEAAPVTPLLRPAFFVPETQTTSALLAQMRTRTRIALVVDEYGGLAGLVTLEDLLEEIVGDIREEHDDDEAQVLREADGSWLLSGLAHVEELEKRFGIEVGARDFDTVGGLVVSVLGRVPVRGESFEFRGVRVEVLDADRRRVFRVRARRVGSQGREGADAP